MPRLGHSFYSPTNPPVCMSHSFRYAPLVRNNCVCVPLSIIRPLSRTMILSILRRVESLCAIAIVVLPRITVFNDFCISNSFSESRADVASSRISIANLLILHVQLRYAVFVRQIVLYHDFQPMCYNHLAEQQ